MKHETLLQMVVTPMIVAIIGIVGWSLINVVELKEDIATVKTEVNHISETVDKMSAQLALNSEVEELEYVNIDKIVRFANGDMRKAIVNLQFGIRDIPMDNLLKAIEERKFDGIQESIYELMDNRYSGRRIFRKIFKIVMDRPEICYTCSKVDGQCNETIQLLKVCSHFT